MAKLIYESQESLYQKACAVTKSIDSIVQYRFKAENYQKAADMFRQVGNYLDAPQRAQECEKQAQKLLDDEKDYRYKQAVEHLSLAVDVPDYESTADELRELEGYRDSETLLKECEEKKNVILNKRKRKVIAFAAVIIAAAAACAMFFRSGLWGRLKADIMDETYVDKSLPIWEQELVLLRAAKKGDTVAFGPYEWRVLARTEENLTLMVSPSDSSKLLEKLPWQEGEAGDAAGNAAGGAADAGAQAGEAGETGWEESSLRAWLNGEFLEEGFLDEELELIAGAGSGETGADKDDAVTLLSLDDLKTYRKVLKDYRQNAWLKDAGEMPGTAAWMGPGGTGYAYGYPAGSDLLRVYPVITVEA